MFITMTNYIMAGLGVIALIIWLIMYFKSSRYDDMTAGLSENEYPLKELYGIGLAFLDSIKYGYKSDEDRKLRQQLAILYPEKYTEYYLHIVHAQQITLSFTIIVAAFIMYGLGNDIAIFLIFLFMAGFIYYYYGIEPQNKIKKRSEQMMSDFSEVVSNLALLTNAGMVLKDAWAQIAYSGEGTLYLEMQRVVDDMNNGIADVDAIYRFGVRCIIPEIKKFSSTITQGIIKGNSELALMLQEQSSEVWNTKKQNARRAGEKAASKLLIPIFIMFTGVLIMIIVPIFTNLM